MGKLFLVGLVVLLAGCFDDTKVKTFENAEQTTQIEQEDAIHDIIDEEFHVAETSATLNSQFNPDDYISFSQDTFGGIRQFGALQLYTISNVANDEQLYNAYMQLLDNEAYFRNQETPKNNMMSEYERADHIRTNMNAIQELIQSAKTKLVIPLIHEYNPSADLWDKKKSLSLYLEVYRDMLYKHELGSSFFNIEVQGTSCKSPNTICDGFHKENNYRLPFSTNINVRGYETSLIFKNSNPYLVFPFNGISVQSEQEARELEKLLHARNVYWEGKAFIDILKSDESNEWVTHNLESILYNKSINLPFIYTALEVQFFNKETGQPITNKRLLLPHQGENTETFQYIPQ